MVYIYTSVFDGDYIPVS